MLGLLLLYFIGKSFYKLAEEHNKHKWGFTIIGVASYYVGTFVAGILIAIFYEFILLKNSDSINDFVLSLITIPFGLLACWGVRELLKKQWNSKLSLSEDILDEEFLDR